MIPKPEPDVIKHLKSDFSYCSYNKGRHQNSLAAAPRFGRELQLTYKEMLLNATAFWLHLPVMNFNLFPYKPIRMCCHGLWLDSVSKSDGLYDCSVICFAMLQVRF